MGKNKKWLYIIGAAITIIIAVLNSSFLFISAAFYRGSLVSRIESEDLSSSSIANLENEISRTGNVAVAHIILTAVIIICCILFIIFLKTKHKPKRIGYIGIAVSCFSIMQIILTIDMPLFIILSSLSLIFGIVLIIIGFSKKV